MSLNVCAIVGRLVADPELKYTPQGHAVCSFRLACDRNFKDAEGNKQTDWIDCVAWRQSAEFLGNYGGKGRMVSVAGAIQTRSWVQQDGQKRSKTEVLVNAVALLDKAKDGDDGPRPAAAAAPGAVGAEDPDMDDPFASED